MSAPRRDRGPIAFMARHPVASNLLMFIVFVLGIMGLFRAKQEVFPEFELDVVSVAVPYPGASPAEVEQGIALAVEEEVRGLDGVKRVTSTSAEGMGTVAIELLLGVDRQKVLADVKSAVDAIPSLPEEAEEPVVSLVSRRQEVISLVIAGDQELGTLHRLAERARAELLASPDITQVDVVGVPPLEIAIGVPRETLEGYGLSLEDVAAQVAAASVELPGGGVRTRRGEVLVRVADRRVEGHQFEDIILRGTSTGARIRLGEIATIRDGHAETDEATFYDGRPAVRVTAYRVGDETPAGVAAAVREYAAQLEADLPDNVAVAIWQDDSEILAARMDLLIRNARLGLVLVFVVLALFLRLRLAFWVALGIPISFLGAFALMPALGLSINMITLFAFIVTLGMVVDDAIVVGENAYAKIEEGAPRLQAAIDGAREMAVPVTFSILTTIAAFSPMLFVPGTMGKIFANIPWIVIAVLGFSLLESFFVLPAHLGHGRREGLFTRLERRFDPISLRVSGVLERFTARVYEPSLRTALRWRYLAVATAVGLFLATAGLVGSGWVPFNFFPNLEGDLVTVSARLPYGTPLERTLEVRRELERAAAAATAELGGREGLVRGMFTRVGSLPRGDGPPGGGEETGSHLVAVELSLVPSDEREISAEDFSGVWEAKVPPLAGVESLVFRSSVGPGAGSAVDVQLIHADTETLAAASEELDQALRTYPILRNVQNSWSAGKPQLDFHLLPAGRTLGLTSADVARQLRAAFHGSEALREQRGRNEVRVMVRLPEPQRRSLYHLEELQVRTPAGALVPLAHVATVEEGHAPTRIVREEGRRTVNVSASLAPGVPSAREVLDSLEDEVLPDLKERHPGLEAEFVGQQREQAEAFAALQRNYVVALFAIFALLAIPFRSYLQPLVVMSAIPFGFVGAVAGHVLMRYELSLISLFGIVALSGVVVNDSLVLIDAVNKARAGGMELTEALVYGGMRRLRPILLTSLTTFFGLAPMILERSVQARFLVPMAISLGFGVLFATVLILVLVPALYLILEDLVGLTKRAFSPEREPDPRPAPEPPAA